MILFWDMYTYDLNFVLLLETILGHVSDCYIYISDTVILLLTCHVLCWCLSIFSLFILSKDAYTFLITAHYEWSITASMLN